MAFDPFSKILPTKMFRGRSLGSVPVTYQHIPSTDAPFVDLQEAGFVINTNGIQRRFDDLQKLKEEGKPSPYGTLPSKTKGGKGEDFWPESEEELALYYYHWKSNKEHSMRSGEPLQGDDTRDKIATRRTLHNIQEFRDNRPRPEHTPGRVEGVTGHNYDVLTRYLPKSNTDTVYDNFDVHFGKAMESPNELKTPSSYEAMIKAREDKIAAKKYSLKAEENMMEEISRIKEILIPKSKAYYGDLPANSRAKSIDEVSQEVVQAIDSGDVSSLKKTLSRLQASRRRAESEINQARAVRNQTNSNSLPEERLVRGYTPGNIIKHNTALLERNSLEIEAVKEALKRLEPK
jgi:hypothetical protein